MNTITHAAPLLAAINILGRMIDAAHRAGDAGREFVVSGVRSLVSVEITFRRDAAAEAHRLDADIEATERLLDQSIGDHVITPAESTQIHAAFRKIEREARHLSQSLDLP